MMSTNPAIMASEINDLNQHIQQLEKLNATLAAQIDRQAKVVKAALDWYYVEDGASRTRGSLGEFLAIAVDNYEQQIAQLARDGE